MARRAVFIDRDGTLSAEAGLIRDPSDLELFPFATSAVKRINRAGWQAVVITNQPWIGHGKMSEDELADVHEQLRQLLLVEDARLDGIYHCPHHPEATVERYKTICDCRKPGIGMLQRAADEMGVELPLSFVVGDRLCDIEAALKAGSRPVLVRTGRGSETEQQIADSPLKAAHVADDLGQALDWIFEQSEGG